MPVCFFISAVVYTFASASVIHTSIERKQLQAQVAKLVDALVSEASGSNTVLVQVQSWALQKPQSFSAAVFLFWVPLVPHVGTRCIASLQGETQ